MSEVNTKVIVIVGATGNQGFSCAETFLASSEWHVRCMTRNPSSAAAANLKKMGAEVVQADLGDPESLEAAFDGAHSIFANTDFWVAWADPELAAQSAKTGRSVGELAFDVEVKHGRNIADAAAKVVGLERFVFSALPPVAKASANEIANCYHWDSKAAIMEYIEKSRPKLAAKMSRIYLGCYATNWFIIPRWNDATQKYNIIIPLDPHVKLPIIDAKGSTGSLVRALVEDEEPQTQLLAYDYESNLTIPEVQQIWSRATGKEIGFPQVTIEEVSRNFGIPMEILAGPQIINKYGYMYGVSNHIEPPQLQKRILTRSYEEWVKENWQTMLVGGPVGKVGEAE